MSRDLDLLLETIASTMRDPDFVVRNNSLRALSDVVWFHPEGELGIDAVLDALEFPTTLDRNKAAAVLDGMLAHRKVPTATRAHIVQRSGRILVAMLRLQQPNNHRFAHSILVKLAGRDLGERSYAQWERWVDEQS